MDIIKGQMSIFDYPEALPTKTDNKVINHLIDDIEKIYPGKVKGIEYTVWEHVPKLGKRLWLEVNDVGLEYDLTDIVNKYLKAELEVSINEMPCYEVENGIDLYISTMWKTKGHKPVEEYEFQEASAELSPAEQWEKDSGCNDYWQMHDVVTFKNDKPICKYSQHTCNKKELWNIADTLDDVNCPKICCRKCDIDICGARCNGIEIVEVDVRGICDDGYCPKCNSQLDDLEKVCPECGTRLDWTFWKKLNEV